jgi:hypothetical protein
MGISPIYLLIRGLSSKISEFVPYPQQLTGAPGLGITSTLGVGGVSIYDFRHMADAVAAAALSVLPLC